MFPELTRPRGSKNATLASFASAWNIRNASAKVAASALPAFLAVWDLEVSGDDFCEVAGWLNNPVQDFGAVQALTGGGGGVFFSASGGCSPLVPLVWGAAVAVSAAAWGDDWVVGGVFWEDGEVVGREMILGMAGIMGTTGRGRTKALGVWGLTSCAVGTARAWFDEGVVGFVEPASSEVGREVGVSGRASLVFTLGALETSAPG